MKFPFFGSRAAPVELRSASVENPTVAVSAENFLSFFGVDSAKLPNVTIARALTVPAVSAAVLFLSRTLATIPLHAYTRKGGSPERVKDGIAMVLEFPNPEMDDTAFRRYFWQQVFTGGRGLIWIERDPATGTGVKNLWPLNPAKTTIRRVSGRTVYQNGGNTYASADIIDVPFALKEDGLAHHGPIVLTAKAIQLALAMNDYASGFFANGGVPPLGFSGPMAAGPDALKRQMADVNRAIGVARSSESPIIPMPPGYELKPIGFDPEKGQMTEARLFQVQEVARGWQLPPVFLQDLSSGTMANTEQQDLHLVKHNVAQWSALFEGQLNLKFYGREGAGEYVEHNLDGLLRGDLLARTNALARGIQTGQLTPNEARALENRPRNDNPVADQLLVQGATVPLGSQPLLAPPVPNADNGEPDASEA